MRTLKVVLALSLLAALLAPAPAHAARKVHGSFKAMLAPFPNLSSATGTERPGCYGGQEGVHWTSKAFKAPGKGKLKITMSGFTGDHDLYVFRGDVKLAESINNQIDGMAPPEESIVLPLKKGQKILMIACNWLGQPEVEAHYTGVFK